MADFTFVTDDNGFVEKILKDGQPYSGATTFEQVYVVVRIYFEMAALNLEEMDDQEKGGGGRMKGVQAFLMSLTGVEAFTNVYFHLYSQQVGRPEILKAAQKRAPISDRLAALVSLALPSGIPDHQAILSEIKTLYRLRNQIVHPRWKPESLSMELEKIKFTGLVLNFHSIFEEKEFCIKAFYFCLILVSRIGIAARQCTDGRGFLFQWTGQFEVPERWLALALGLPPMPTVTAP